jgi:DNA-binding CsgD family transcriptional regulator
MNDVEAAGCERCRWDAVLCAVEAYARTGRCSEAQDLAARWDAHHPEPYAFSRFQRQHAEALLVARGGNAASGVRLFEAAYIEAERLHLSHEALCVEVDLAETLVPINPERAMATLQSAAGLAEVVGSESTRQRAERSLRSLGVRTWRRTPTRRGGVVPALSTRENEIVRLVLEGASNPEIASALFVSRKTVERHVSNILDKLGVRNRTELASAFRRAGEGTHG